MKKLFLLKKLTTLMSLNLSCCFLHWESSFRWMNEFNWMILCAQRCKMIDLGNFFRKTVRTKDELNKQRWYTMENTTEMFVLHNISNQSYQSILIVIAIATTVVISCSIITLQNFVTISSMSLLLLLPALGLRTIWHELFSLASTVAAMYSRVWINT